MSRRRLPLGEGSGCLNLTKGVNYTKEEEIIMFHDGFFSLSAYDLMLKLVAIL